jgi:hypothetical protein
MKLKLLSLVAVAVVSCASGRRPLAGDSLCVGLTDSGAPQATVNADGINITIPLGALIMKRPDDAGAPLIP